MRTESWLYFKQSIPTETCDHIINQSKNYPIQDATIGFNTGNKIDTAFRKSELRWINPDAEPKIKDIIWYHANRANRDSFDVDLRYINDIQFTKYVGDSETPGKYDWHHDVDWQETKAFHRKLSLVIQLTDPDEYEGGDFEFDSTLPQLPPEAKLKGSVIVFPSFHVHRVTPVTKGVRHSLVTWVEGPHWR